MRRTHRFKRLNYTILPSKLSKEPCHKDTFASLELDIAMCTAVENAIVWISLIRLGLPRLLILVLHNFLSHSGIQKILCLHFSCHGFTTHGRVWTNSLFCDFQDMHDYFGNSGSEGVARCG